jgi:hypothetical protein
MTKTNPVTKKRKRRTQSQIAKSWSMKMYHVRKREAEEFTDNFKPGDMVSIRHFSKTIGMLLSEPYPIKEPWSTSTRFKVDIHLYKLEGVDTSDTHSVYITDVCKFKPWPYFYRRKKGDTDAT